MSYQVHNFKTGEVIEAAPVNEMDAQIKANEEQIALKVSSSDIYNGLDQASSGKVLDARQGKALDDAKADKVTSATNGNFAALDANGNIVDSGHKHSDYLTQHQDISGKADKVTSATNGNFAGLDANGNLTDSGHKHSDYLTEHQDISGKVDKVTSAAYGEFSVFDGNGNLMRSGFSRGEFIGRVNWATNGNYPALTSSGQLVDSGHKHSDYATKEYVDDLFASLINATGASF